MEHTVHGGLVPLAGVRTVNTRLPLGLLTLWLGCSERVEQPDKPPLIKTSYRVLTGISMGAIGAVSLGLTHPDQVDAVASLGGPIDAAFFQHTLDESAAAKRSSYSWPSTRRA